MTRRRPPTSAAAGTPHLDGAADIITAIEVDVRDPNRRRVRVGRQIVATLSAESIEALDLRVGLRCDEACRHRIQERVSIDLAWRAALQLLGRRALTRSEARHRLAARGFEQAVVDRVVTDLIAHGWLDDARVAADAAEAITRRRPAARAAITKRLKARGIDAAQAESAARGALSAEHEQQAAVDLARTRLRGLARLSPAARVRRLAGALERRGFDEETIRRALREVGVDIDLLREATDGT